MAARLPARVTMGRTGVLGGTFDPIHLGHLGAAEAAARALALDVLLLMPSRTPPHRSLEPQASPFHRFAMAALAAADRGYQVSDLELRRDGTSYTSLTLEALHRDGRAAADLFFITGADAFAEVASWHDYPRLFSLAHFVVVSRPGAPGVRDAADAAGAEGGGSTRIHLVEAATPDVSSTDIRQRVARGEPIDGLVPPAVADHIRRHRLYVPAPVAAFS